MSTPTVDQLLNLADRAERGLRPEEAQRLRDGIHHLAGELAQTRHYRIPCPHCGARAGETCRATAGGTGSCTPHTARLHAATQPEAPMTYLRDTELEKAAYAAQARYQAGVSVRAIAEEIGRSYGYVHRLLLLVGTDMRPRGRVPAVIPGRRTA